MYQQVLIISGGTTFDSHEEYIHFLQSRPLDLDQLRPGVGWKDALAQELGEGYEVLVPRMPNRTNAQFEEWAIWFSRMVELLEDELILIGHSLGGIFLAKYLSENEIRKSVKATMLVAAPFSEGRSETLGSFQLPVELSLFEKQAGDVHLFQSKDDPIVVYSEVEKYKTAIPSATLHVFEDRLHFNQETFPEIVEVIRQLR